ncbi:MFS transporter [Streptomyces tendae]
MSGIDKDVGGSGVLADRPTGAATGRQTRYRHRWTVLGAVFGAQFLNYVDRSAISLAAPFIIAEYSFSPATWGWILGLFFVGYVPFCFIGGWAADRFGVRRVMTLAVTTWSLFTAATAAGFNFLSFGVIRMLFGAGEGQISPVAVKTVFVWFPEKRFSTAIGTQGMATPLGGAIGTPVVVAMIAATDSWRGPFVILGVIGLVAALGCWVLVRDHPSEHPWTPLAEIEEMRREDERVAARYRTADGTAKENLRDHIFKPVVWLCAFTWFGVIWLLYTFLNWFPLYLTEVHGVDLKGLALANSVPWVAGSAGLFLGGLLTDALARRYGGSPFTPRKWMIVVCVLLAGALLPLITVARTTVSAMLVMAAVLLLIYGPLGQLNSVIAGAVPKSVYGGVCGFAQLIGNTAGILSPIVIGYLLETSFGWNGIWLLAGLVAVVPVLALAFFRSRSVGGDRTLATS